MCLLITEDTHFLFLGVDQLFVIPVLQLPGGLGGWDGGVEDEKFPATLCCLRGKEELKRSCGFFLVMNSSTFSIVQCSVDLGVLLIPADTKYNMTSGQCFLLCNTEQFPVESCV